MKNFFFVSILAVSLTSIAYAEDRVAAAVDATTGAPVYLDTEVHTEEQSASYVDTQNLRVKLAPHSVAEFLKGGEFRLYRGSALLEAASEKKITTAGAGLSFVGKVLLSYDYKEKSTSTFVILGDARLENPYDKEHTLHVDKNHGATMVVGQVFPSLIRQLDLASLQDWLKGYAWSEADRKDFLSGYEQNTRTIASDESAAPQEAVTLQDYYTTIDSKEDHPEYYEKKFADPDKVMADAKAVANKTKSVSPEEAALISLPSTKIDVDLGVPIEFVTSAKRQSEMLQNKAPKKVRALASVTQKSKAEKNTRLPSSVKAAPVASGDTDVDAALSRLQAIGSDESMPVAAPVQKRAPASVPQSVPDPVYDYSQNF